MFNDYFSLICFATAQINVTNYCVMQRNRKAHKWICLCWSFPYPESGAGVLQITNQVTIFFLNSQIGRLISIIFWSLWHITYCTTILVETFLCWTRVTTVTTNLFKQYQNVKDAFVMIDQAFLICGLRSRVRLNWSWKEGFITRK